LKYKKIKQSKRFEVTILNTTTSYPIICYLKDLLGKYNITIIQNGLLKSIDLTSYLSGATIEDNIIEV
jgi:hypothetical protein